MLGNYKNISPKCEGCCHEGESYLYWMFCEYCTRNTKAKELINDKWKPMIDKYIYYDSR